MEKIGFISCVLVSLGISAIPIYGGDYMIQDYACCCTEQATYTRLEAHTRSIDGDAEYLLNEFLSGNCLRLTPGQAVTVLNFGTAKINDRVVVLAKVRVFSHRSLSDFWTDAEVVFGDQ
jgi:hypothetical protein